MIRLINSYTGEVKEVQNAPHKVLEIKTMKRLIRDENKQIREWKEANPTIDVNLTIESNDGQSLLAVKRYVLQMRTAPAAPMTFKLV